MRGALSLRGVDPQPYTVSQLRIGLRFQVQGLTFMAVDFHLSRVCIDCYYFVLHREASVFYRWSHARSWLCWPSGNA